MDKAYIDFVALYSMHWAGSFVVTRAKVTLNYEDMEYNYNIDERTGLRCDKTIKLTGPKSKQLYPEILRIVEYFDEEKDLLLVFLTNNFDASALEIAWLYKNHWQIEVFFKQNIRSIKLSKNNTIF